MTQIEGMLKDIKIQNIYLSNSQLEIKMDVIKSLVADNLKTLITTDSKLKDCLFELKSF